MKPNANKKRIADLEAVLADYRKACERANATNARLTADSGAVNRHNMRMIAFLRDEASRARAYGSPRLAEIFEDAAYPHPDDRSN